MCVTIQRKGRQNKTGDGRKEKIRKKGIGTKKAGLNVEEQIIYTGKKAGV